MSILDIAIPTGWENLFNNSKEDLKHISKFLEKDESEYGMWLPRQDLVFKAFEMIQPKDIRVVIIGQDPYPQILNNGEPRAQGLSFSVAKTDIIPQSLDTIFKEISRSIPGFSYPTHGDLTNWVNQGVFLLNMSLTVRINSPDSHGRRWMGFLIRTLQEISRHSPNAIYLLWGAKAQGIKQYIKDPAVVLTAGHPSPLNKTNPFIGNGNFLKVNQILKDNPIDWNL